MDKSDFAVLMSSLFAAVAMILDKSPSWIPAVLALGWLLILIVGEIADRRRN